MKIFYIALIFILSNFSIPASISHAQEHSERQNLDKFYKPMEHKDIMTFVAPRRSQENSDNLSNSSTGSGFFSGGGCPETIDIGSIDSDTPVFGSVDIEVVINSDITIVCQ